jgi:hypothetical protein
MTHWVTRLARQHEVATRRLTPLRVGSRSRRVGSQKPARARIAFITAFWRGIYLTWQGALLALKEGRDTQLEKAIEVVTGL